MNYIYTFSYLIAGHGDRDGDQLNIKTKFWTLAKLVVGQFLHHLFCLYTLNIKKYMQGE